MRAQAATIPADAFEAQIRVRSYEVGRDGAARPATILRYLENLATEASASVGFDPAWYTGQGSAWVVRAMRLTLGVPPRFGDELRLATWVAEFRHVQAFREYAIWHAATGQLVARAEARWAYVDRAKGVPRRLPDAMTNAMRALGHRMPHHEPRSVEESESSSESTIEVVAREYEEDSQLHINNCTYVDWLSEAARASLPSNRPPRARRYELEYIRPTVAGDQIRIIARLLPHGSRFIRGHFQMIHARSGMPCLRGTADFLCTAGRNEHAADAASPSL